MKPTRRLFPASSAATFLAGVTVVVASSPLALGKDDPTKITPQRPPAAAEMRAEPVQVRTSGEGDGRRLSVRGIAAAKDVLREMSRASELKMEDPDEAIRPFLESRVLCEFSGYSIEEACDVVAGTCGLRAEFPSPGMLRIVASPDALPLGDSRAIEGILDGIGTKLDRLTETDGDCGVHAESALALAHAWLAAGSTARAATRFAAIDSPSMNAEPVTRRLARLGLAWCDVTTGRTAAGYAAAERLVGENDADPAAIEASALLAQEAISRGDGRLAVERVAVALRSQKVTPELLDTLRLAIAACRDLPSRRAAFDTLRRTVEDHTDTPADAPLHLELATLAESIGNSGAAVHEAARACHLQPDGLEGAEALRRLGRSLYVYDPARALLCLETARILVPSAERAKMCLDLARLCRRTGLTDLAVERYEEAGAPADATGPISGLDAAVELADILLDEGQPTRAADLFERVATEAGYESRAAAGILRARLVQKDLTGALDVARSSRARLLGEDGRPMLAALAQALAREGRDADALEVLAMAPAVTPKDEGEEGK
ncbi:MAG: hypothetical protein HYR85_06175 [Planctomycetes bacterium]|nr:hypothetical protein [Planctomycetota bacterium]MBI3843015.1 hypothetical protein [Planctomycetota bacterium]